MDHAPSSETVSAGSKRAVSHVVVGIWVVHRRIVPGPLPRQQADKLLWGCSASRPISQLGLTSQTVTPHQVICYNFRGRAAYRWLRRHRLCDSTRCRILQSYDRLFLVGPLLRRATNSILDGSTIDAIGLDGSGHLLLSFDVDLALLQTGGETLTAKPATK